MRQNKPFKIKDCALIPIATGYKAQSLREFRDYIMRVDIECIYHHFWGSLMAPVFEEPEFNNDFASWVYKELNDPVLAERLAVIDPSDFTDLEDLRQEIVDRIDERLDEIEYVPVAKYDKQFHFIKGHIVVFDTHKQIQNPDELADAVIKMSTGSIFYHFIDARRRTPDNIDDFRAWLYGFDSEFESLCRMLTEIDPFFTTLSDLREKLYEVFSLWFKK